MYCSKVPLTPPGRRLHGQNKKKKMRCGPPYPCTYSGSSHNKLRDSTKPSPKPSQRQTQAHTTTSETETDPLRALDSRHMHSQKRIGSTHAAREASQDACTVLKLSAVTAASVGAAAAVHTRTMSSHSGDRSASATRVQFRPETRWALAAVPARARAPTTARVDFIVDK
jgi:hypothetical protein